MIKDIIKFLFTSLLYTKKEKEASVELEPVKVMEESIVVEKKKELISYEDYITASGKYKTRLYHEDLLPEYKENAKKLLEVVNPFLEELGVTSCKVSSGFRPAAINAATKGAGTKSKHLSCEAIDLEDVDGKIMNLILNNLDKLQKYNLACENWDWTPSWSHIQNVLPNSGKRIFIPSNMPAPAPKRWVGTYDAKFDKKV